MKKLMLLVTMITIAAWAGSAAAYDYGKVDIHGFISQGYLSSNEYNYLAHNSKDGSFEYNEMGINFSSQLSDKLRIGVQFFARDLGDAANNRVTVDWAFADYRFQDYLGLRIGRIKLPLGLYNDTRDMDMLRTSVVLPQGIYPDLLRDNTIAINGASAYGNVDMGAAGGLEYQVLAGAINSDRDSGTGKFTSDSIAAYGGQLAGDADNDTVYVGALRWETPLSGLRLGYTLIDGKVDLPLSIMGNIMINENDYTGHYYSAEYSWNDLILAAEYWTRKTDVTMGPSESTIEAESYYLMASYRFNDWFTLGAYYSEYYPDKDDKEGDNEAIDHRAWEKDLALTLRFDINEYWIAKLEGHSVDGTANVLTVDNDGNDFSESTWSYIAAKLTFSF